MSSFTIMERISWMNGRDTTFPEDQEKCLLGILGSEHAHRFATAWNRARVKGKAQRHGAHSPSTGLGRFLRCANIQDRRSRPDTTPTPHIVEEGSEQCYQSCEEFYPSEGERSLPPAQGHPYGLSDLDDSYEPRDLDYSYELPGLDPLFHSVPHEPPDVQLSDMWSGPVGYVDAPIQYEGHMAEASTFTADTHMENHDAALEQHEQFEEPTALYKNARHVSGRIGLTKAKDFNKRGKVRLQYLKNASLISFADTGQLTDPKMSKAR